MGPNDAPSIVGGQTAPIPAANAMGDLEHQLGILTDLVDRLQSRLSPFVGIVAEPTPGPALPGSIPSHGSSKFVAQVATLTDILRNNNSSLKGLLNSLEI